MSLTFELLYFCSEQVKVFQQTSILQPLSSRQLLSDLPLIRVIIYGDLSSDRRGLAATYLINPGRQNLIILL